MDIDPNLKILVVDDAVSIRKMVKASLSELGFADFTEAEDGAIAWKLLQQSKTDSNPFQLIVCDWNMPQMEGIQLLELVRGDAQYKSIPFILATAEGAKWQVLQAIKLGCSSYIMKPFSPSLIKEKVTKVLEKSSAKKPAA